MANRALLDHCMRVYEAMLNEAGTDEAENIVYTGRLTYLFKELGYTVPFYSNVTTELKRMGCIEQIQRGTASQPSKWFLLQEPSKELFDNMASPTHNAFGGTKWQNQVNQQLRSLMDRVAKLEANETKVLEDAFYQPIAEVVDAD